MKSKNSEIEQFLIDNDLPCNEATWGLYTIVSGVKTEWNTQSKCLVVGYTNSEKDLENLKNLMNENFDNSVHKENATIRFLKNPTTADFYKLIEIIRNLPFTIEKPFGVKRGSVLFNQEGYFVKTAKAIRFAVNNEYPHLLNRTALGFDAVDHIISVGESINRTPENSYREHIVPCDFIIREAVEMIRDGKNDTEIALMIKNNLSIVKITNEEANKLDNELFMKTTMPENWKIGDDPLARLKIASIKLK